MNSQVIHQTVRQLLIPIGISMFLGISLMGIGPGISIDGDRVESYETDSVEAMSVPIIELDNDFIVSASIDPTTGQVRLDPISLSVSIAGVHESNRIVLEE